jgi:hypothetical protein
MPSLSTILAVRTNPINSNTIFGVLAFGTLFGHLAILVATCFWPRFFNCAPLLNLLVAVSVLGYGLSRARYIWRAHDWHQSALMGFEVLVLVTAVLTFREARWASVGSWVAFGIHGCFSIAAVVYLCTFKITRLI